MDFASEPRWFFAGATAVHEAGPLLMVQCPCVNQFVSSLYGGGPPIDDGMAYRAGTGRHFHPCPPRSASGSGKAKPPRHRRRGRRFPECPRETRASPILIALHRCRIGVNPDGAFHHAWPHCGYRSQSFRAYGNVHHAAWRDRNLFPVRVLLHLDVPVGPPSSPLSPSPPMEVPWCSATHIYQSWSQPTLKC